MNSPFYDNANTAMDTSPMQDGVIEDQQFVSIDSPETVAPDTNAGINTMFGANFLAPGYQGNIAADTTAMRIVGNQNKTFIGIMNGLAEQNNRRIEEGFLTQSAMNGLKPLEATQAKVQETVDLANATDEAVKNLSQADAELKAEQAKAKEIEQLILGAKYVAPSDQAYIQSIDQLAEMQKNAPVAPTLEQPELTTTDQALIFLAGLIGGNQQVPQAVQGAVAGAQQRAALANQMKTQRFNQEQQNYNRQLQAQQTIVGKEAQVFNQAQQIAAQNYRTEYNNLVRRKAEQADVIKNAETRLDKKQTDALRRLRNSYEFMTKNQDKYTKDNAEAIAKARAYAISNLGLSEAEASVAFPAIQEGQLTLKGEVMKRRQVNDEARLRLAQTNQSLAGIKEATSRVENYLKTITKDGILTQVEATAVNAQFDEEAKRLGVPRSLFPVIDPFTTLQKQTADQQESNRQFMRNLAIQRLGIAQAREQRLQQAESAFPGTSLKDLNKKLETANSAVASLTGQYNLKVKQGDAKEIAKAETALRGAKDKQEYLNLLIQEKSGTTPPEVQFLYTDLGQAITSGIFGDPADPEAQRTIRAARQIVANRQRRQQQGAQIPAEDLTRMQSQAAQINKQQAPAKKTTVPPTLPPVKKEAQGPFLAPEQITKQQPQKPKNTGVTASGVKYRKQ